MFFLSRRLVYGYISVDLVIMAKKSISVNLYFYPLVNGRDTTPKICPCTALPFVLSASRETSITNHL